MNRTSYRPRQRLDRNLDAPASALEKSEREEWIRLSEAEYLTQDERARLRVLTRRMVVNPSFDDTSGA